jgi:hypothetical protein
LIPGGPRRNEIKGFPYEVFGATGSVKPCHTYPTWDVAEEFGFIPRALVCLMTTLMATPRFSARPLPVKNRWKTGRQGKMRDLLSLGEE